MPRRLPDEVAASISNKMPPSHQMVWVRCEVMGVEQVERPPYVSGRFFSGKGKPAVDTRVAVFDKDTGEGWDVRLTFDQDIAAGDTVSLFGHEPVGANRLTVPRLLYNHNTDRYDRAYRDISTATGTALTEIDYKYVLSCRLPATLNNRRRDIGRKFRDWFLTPSLPPGILLRNYLLAAPVALYLATVVFRLLLALFVPWVLLLFLNDLMLGMVFFMALSVSLMVFVMLKLRHLIYEPPRFRGDVEYSLWELMGLTNLSDYLRYVYWDITPVYEDAAQGVAAWVRENPDEVAEFIAPPLRGTGEKGRIQQSPEIALPEGTTKRIPPTEGGLSLEPS